MDKKIIKDMYEGFIRDDKAEPFTDREYVKHCKEIYEAILKTPKYEDSYEKAIQDVYNEIIYREHNPKVEE